LSISILFTLYSIGLSVGLEYKMLVIWTLAEAIINYCLQNYNHYSSLLLASEQPIKILHSQPTLTPAINLNFWICPQRLLNIIQFLIP